MDDALNHGFVAAHVIYVSSRSDGEAEKLITLMIRGAWPAGHEDRYDPGAAEWLRHWDLDAMPLARIDCSCFEGRCAVCN